MLADAFALLTSVSTSLMVDGNVIGLAKTRSAAPWRAKSVRPFSVNESIRSECHSAWELGVRRAGRRQVKTCPFYGFSCFMHSTREVKVRFNNMP